MIRPLADAGDDVAELWLARWLADCDHLGELRQRAAAGGYHALQELARRLANRNMVGELPGLAGAVGLGDRLRILRAARGRVLAGDGRNAALRGAGRRRRPSWSDPLAGPDRASR